MDKRQTSLEARPVPDSSDDLERVRSFVGAPEAGDDPDSRGLSASDGGRGHREASILAEQMHPGDAHALITGSAIGLKLTLIFNFTACSLKPVRHVDSCLANVPGWIPWRASLDRLPLPNGNRPRDPTRRTRRRDHAARRRCALRCGVGVRRLRRSGARDHHCGVGFGAACHRLRPQHFPVVTRLARSSVRVAPLVFSRRGGAKTLRTPSEEPLQVAQRVSTERARISLPTRCTEPALRSSQARHSSDTIPKSVAPMEPARCRSFAISIAPAPRWPV